MKMLTSNDFHFEIRTKLGPCESNRKHLWPLFYPKSQLSLSFYDNALRKEINHVFPFAMVIRNASLTFARARPECKWVILMFLPSCLAGVMRTPPEFTYSRSILNCFNSQIIIPSDFFFFQENCAQYNWRAALKTISQNASLEGCVCS